MQIAKKRVIAYIVIAFLVGVLITGAASALIYNGLTGHVTVPKEDYDTMSSVYEKYAKLEQLNQAIDKYYYKGFDEEALLDGAYKGL